MKRIRYLSLPVAIVILLCISTIALAVVGDVTHFKGNPTDVSVILTWVKASGSTNTVVQYKTSGFPTTYSDGTNAYNGVNSEVTLSSLTSGTTYYFAAWGWDGAATYSTNAAEYAVTTLAAELPSGGPYPTPTAPPTPTASANLNQTPSTTGFNLEPFTSIITFFNSSTGGFGMPIENAWEFLAILGIIGSGVLTYLKIKNFFVAYFVMFAATFLGVGLHLVQGYLIGVEIIIGMGVWAIERYAQ